jgi:hypothetical protein
MSFDLLIGQTSSKIPMILDRRPKDVYLFGVFLSSLWYTLSIEFELESDLAVENVSSLEELVKSYGVLQGMISKKYLMLGNKTLFKM